MSFCEQWMKRASSYMCFHVMHMFIVYSFSSCLPEMVHLTQDLRTSNNYITRIVSKLMTYDSVVQWLVNEYCKIKNSPVKWQSLDHHWRHKRWLYNWQNSIRYYFITRQHTRFPECFALAGGTRSKNVNNKCVQQL